jgi:hypothetical protein
VPIHGPLVPTLGKRPIFPSVGSGDLRQMNESPIPTYHPLLRRANE